MPDAATVLHALTANATLIAATSGIAAILAIVVAAAFAVTSGLSAKRASQAASALIDVHLEQVDERILIARESAVPLTASSRKLAASCSRLSDSVRQLSTILGAVGTERQRMYRRIIDVLLPTDGSPVRTGMKAKADD